MWTMRKTSVTEKWLLAACCVMLAIPWIMWWLKP